MNSRIRNEIENFKIGILNRNPNKHKSLRTVGDYASIQAAVDLAYNDAKRTMTGIGNRANDKNDALTEIAEGLKEYFDGPAPSGETDFDSKHEALCRKWCDKFPNSNLGTYGKAQKIVNMSFKYLLCCDDANKYSAHFKYCHMPLDSFTLEWIKRFPLNCLNNPRQVNTGKITSWSKLEKNGNQDTFTASDNKEYYSYDYYLKYMRTYIKNSNEYMPLTPLQVEFIIWPKIQMDLAAESFLFALKENMSTDEKMDIMRKSLSDKKAEIKQLL